MIETIKLLVILVICTSYTSKKKEALIESFLMMYLLLKTKQEKNCIKNTFI